jgi:hypothetical protein
MTKREGDDARVKTVGCEKITSNNATTEPFFNSILGLEIRVISNFLSFEGRQVMQLYFASPTQPVGRQLTLD